MSVQLVLIGDSNKMTCTCLLCRGPLPFVVSLSPDGKNKVFSASTCSCLDEPKPPEYKLCRNCGVEFSIPSFCKDCEGQ
jgi:hypothetical protein